MHGFLCIEGFHGGLTVHPRALKRRTRTCAWTQMARGPEERDVQMAGFLSFEHLNLPAVRHT